MAKSGIYIKPSKRGTFTSAAKKRGKSVQGFASTVLANKENYTPAMVKKANFARNAAKWKKQFGGYLDQQLNEVPIQDTIIESEPVPQTVFQDGGYLDLSAVEKKQFDADAKAMGHTREEHAAHTFQWGGSLTVGRGGNQRTFGAQQLAERHPELSNLKYLDLPDTDWGSLAMNIGGSALAAYTGAGGTFGQGSGGGGGAGFDIGSTSMADIMSRSHNAVGTPTSTAGFQDGGLLPNQGQDQEEAVERHRMEVKQEEFEDLMSQLSDTMQEGYHPVYQDGGQLIGYLPEYSFGSWLGDNAGKILKGVGGVVSVIPGFGQIAGPILIGAGYATDAIVGAVRKNRAEDELEQAEQLEQEGQARLEDVQGQVAGREDQIQYGATFQIGGSLMGNQNPDFPSESENPVIVGYNGNSNTHEQGVGGVPVDAKGNPSAVSKQSAVGLTEKGEVTWNGYVFSDKLKDGNSTYANKAKAIMKKYETRLG